MGRTSRLKSGPLGAAPTMSNKQSVCMEFRFQRELAKPRFYQLRRVSCGKVERRWSEVVTVARCVSEGMLGELVSSFRKLNVQGC